MSLEFIVPKLACEACVNTVTQAIHALDPQATVAADPKTKQVLITSTQPETALRETLSRVGYPAS
jgi:copper chaperone